MSNLARHEFEPFRQDGKNYDEWAEDAMLHLNAMNLGETVKDGNTASLQEQSKAIILLRHHLPRSMKSEYLSITDPLVL